MSSTDSIPLEKIAVNSGFLGCDPSVTTNMKSLSILFILFLFVLSDIYTNSILCSIPGATSERNATNTGIMLQGISLVIFFILANLLITNEIL